MNRSEIKVDKGILDATTHCMFDFGCLAGVTTCLCGVVASNNEDIVEIKPNLATICKYRITLASASYCHCPTRVEIYKRYQL